MKRPWAYAWTSPWSLVGFVLSLFFRRRYVTRGIVLAEGAGWPARLGWPYRAITFGHVVLATEELDEETIRHELVHVHQYERWGPFFIPVYLIASVVTRLRGGHHYRDNPFEVAARRTVPTRK
ncbi:MAG TPA: hypothetical protein VJ927_11375 [Actinomycetota bacterium]|nr:hypothetical protein [Actinomycetota bacterium]